MQFRLLVAFLMLHFALAGEVPKADPAGAKMDPARLAGIRPLLQSFVDKGEVAGAVTLVQRHGKLASLETVGYENLESKRPMRADTIFQIASMTKAVTSVLMMMLVEEGKLNLDDTIEKYLPEFRGLWMQEGPYSKTRLVLTRPPRKITIRDVMTHTSGMAGNPSEGIKEIIIPEMRAHLSLTEAVLVYSQLPLTFEPGTKFSYSNPGIATLGRIIEVVTGKPYEKFLEERILRPLEMTDTTPFLPKEKRPRVAALYDMVDGKLKNMGPMIYRDGARYSMPEGGLYSTVFDMVRFFQMVLNGGVYGGKRFLTRESIQKMTANQIGDLPVFGDNIRGWGLGWTVIRTESGKEWMGTAGSYGHTGAFGTKGWVDPKNDMITLFFVQRYGGARTDRHGFEFLRQAVSAVLP